MSSTLGAAGGAAAGAGWGTGFTLAGRRLQPFSAAPLRMRSCAPSHRPLPACPLPPRLPPPSPRSMPHSNIARVGEDFYPALPASHTAHLANAAFTTLMLGVVAFPDWDMWGSRRGGGHSCREWLAGHCCRLQGTRGHAAWRGPGCGGRQQVAALP